MTVLQWLLAGGAATVAALGLRRVFSSTAASSPLVATTAVDLAAAPTAWRDEDYSAFAQAMARVTPDQSAAADALLFVGNESNYKPSAAYRKNGLVYAAGLNQITKAGSAALGVKPENAQSFLNSLIGMSVAQQIPYVERSLAAGLRGANVTNPKNVGVLYAVNFLPQRVRERGTAPGTVLTVRGEGYYDQNAGLDYDKDGRITILDLSEYLKHVILPRPIFRGALAKLRAATSRPSLSPRFA